MVGWSRRNSESRARRNRWWNSLTPEQKVAARIREQAYDKVVMKWMAAFFGMPILICLIKLAWDALK